MRHPFALLAALVMVAGLEGWAFAVSDEPDPATVRFVIIGSCLVIVLLWFLARTAPGAAAPLWPPRRRHAEAPFVDARTRHLETLLSPDAPPGSTTELADLLAAHLPDGIRPSTGLAAFLQAARTGRPLRTPSPQQVAGWLSEIEDAT